MQITDTVHAQPGQSTARTHPTARALGVAGSVLAALAVWTIAVPLLGVDLQVAPGSAQPQTVGVVAVAASSLIASVTGWASLALLERLTSRARPVWMALAIAVLVVSLMGPQAGVTTAATVTLAAMHLAVGAVLIPVLAIRGTAPDPARR